MWRINLERITLVEVQVIVESNKSVRLGGRWASSVTLSCHCRNVYDTQTVAVIGSCEVTGFDPNVEVRDFKPQIGPLPSNIDWKSWIRITTPATSSSTLLLAYAAPRRGIKKLSSRILVLGWHCRRSLYNSRKRLCSEKLERSSKERRFNGTVTEHYSLEKDTIILICNRRFKSPWRVKRRAQLQREASR